MSKTKTAELTVTLPKRIVDLLMNERFFGMKPDEFMTEAVKSYLSTIDSAMTDEQRRQFYKKYGKNAGGLVYSYLPPAFAETLEKDFESLLKPAAI